MNNEKKENDCGYWISIGGKPRCVIGCKSCENCEAYISKEDVVIEVRQGKKLLATSEEK